MSDYPVDVDEEVEEYFGFDYDDFVSPTLENDEPEEDFLTGVTCNPDAPEECESCQ